MSDTGKLKKKKSECSFQESNLRPSAQITSSDALPLNYRRLVGADACMFCNFLIMMLPRLEDTNKTHARD